jgi:2-oxoisovalerate dehydrogenase E2 component (dihydrolipoyl transacylase)
LQFVPGSGEAGVILHEDLDAFLESQDDGHAVGAGGPMRQGAPARWMTSRRQCPSSACAANRAEDAGIEAAHPALQLCREIDVTELEQLRARLNQRWGESRGKLTLLPLLLRAGGGRGA